MTASRLRLPMAYADPAFDACIAMVLDTPELFSEFDRLYAAELMNGEGRRRQYARLRELRPPVLIHDSGRRFHLRDAKSSNDSKCPIHTIPQAHQRLDARLTPGLRQFHTRHPASNVQLTAHPSQFQRACTQRSLHQPSVIGVGAQACFAAGVKRGAKHLLAAGSGCVLRFHELIVGHSAD